MGLVGERMRGLVGCVDKVDGGETLHKNVQEYGAKGSAGAEFKPTSSAVRVMILYEPRPPVAWNACARRWGWRCVCARGMDVLGGGMGSCLLYTADGAEQ